MSRRTDRNTPARPATASEIAVRVVGVLGPGRAAGACQESRQGGPVAPGMPPDAAPEPVGVPADAPPWRPRPRKTDTSTSGGGTG
ncbi:MAG TPA: hypothetical protein VGD43_12945 [Micromonospora sp.]